MQYDKIREIAIKILVRVYEEGAYSNAALSSALNNEKDINALDRGFITELVYGTLKYTLAFENIISKYSKIKLNKISKWQMSILKTGLYQIFFMDRVPNSAACNESVKLSGKYGHEGSKRFVNGLLRTVIRDTDGKYENIKFQLFFEKYAYPKWLADICIEDFGEEFTKEMMQSNMNTSKLSIRANLLKMSRDELLNNLKEAGYDAIKSETSLDGIILKKVSSIADMKQFRDGLFYVQGESSMLLARILNPKSGNRVLDLCSAPGGKSTHIAELMGNKGVVIAGDIFQHKINKISESAQRLGIDIIEPIINDASQYNKDFKEYFDCVLADVPCSGTGIIRSRPEIKFKKCRADIEELIPLQYSILKNAGEYVKQGGTLVYSTCSVLRNENINQINRFLKEDKRFTLEAIHEIFPQDNDSDGFFIAKMKREQNSD